MWRSKKIWMLIGGSIISYLLHFPLRLLEDWVMGVIGERIAGNWLEILGFFITWVFPFILIFGAMYLGYRLRKPNTISNVDKSDAQSENIINIVDIYEDNIGECGFIFNNTSSTNLINCHAKLLDIGYETPQGSLGFKNYSRVEDLICDQNVAGFSNGKIPLFRWGKGTASKNLEIVYQKETQPIGYGVTNVPILVLLNLWADGTQTTYAVCKLEDRLGWGYQLSILKTGLQQDNPNLATFQKLKPDTGGIDCQ